MSADKHHRCEVTGCQNSTECVFTCQLKRSQAPTVRMQPRDETAQQQALRRAVELIQAHGGAVTMPEQTQEN